VADVIILFTKTVLMITAKFYCKV